MVRLEVTCGKWRTDRRWAAIPFQFEDNVAIFSISVLVAIFGTLVAHTCWIRVTIDRRCK